MKSIILTIILITTFTLSSFGQSNAEAYSAKVALRMKDSLSISNEQKTQVYNINMQISLQKAAVWQQYNGSDSLIRVHLQRIENSRDSLYRPVLTDPQYLLYIQKKRVLLNNN